MKNKIDIEDNLGRYGCTKARFRRGLMRIGYEDNCKEENPYFERRDNDIKN